MKIEDLTIKQAREIADMFPMVSAPREEKTLNGMLGQLVIVRTYSAGVWFGELAEKAGKEVIISNARRMWRWWAAESISLSGVALYGIKRNKSKIAPPVARVWLEAIEIIPCSTVAISSIEGAPNAEAE